MWGHGKKAAVLKPGRRFSPETELASTFILDFSATGTVRNECGLFKLLSLWHFLIAAYAKIILIHTMSHWSRRSLKFFPAKITYNCAISYVKLHCQVNIARPLLKGALKKINVGHLWLLIFLFLGHFLGPSSPPHPLYAFILFPSKPDIKKWLETSSH